jgi:hypothetical protein
MLYEILKDDRGLCDHIRLLVVFIGFVVSCWMKFVARLAEAAA